MIKQLTIFIVFLLSFTFSSYANSITLTGKVQLPKDLNSSYLYGYIDIYQFTCDNYGEESCYYSYVGDIYFNSYDSSNNTIEFNRTIDSYEDSNKYLIRVSYYNNEEDKYLQYNPGTDSNDHSVDGNEYLTDIKDDSKYFEFNTTNINLGTIDLDTYFKDSTVLTGTFIPPKNVVNDYVDLYIESNNSYFHKYIYIDGNNPQDFSLRIGKELQEYLKKETLQFELYFSGCGSLYYSFGKDNAIGGEGENADKIVKDSSTEEVYNLKLDFNNLSPITLDLSNYELPCKKVVAGKIKLPEELNDDHIDGSLSIYQKTCESYYDYGEDSEQEECYNSYVGDIYFSKYNANNNVVDFNISISTNENGLNNYVVTLEYYTNNEHDSLQYVAGKDSNDHSVDGNEYLTNIKDESKYFEFNTTNINLGTIDLDTYFKDSTVLTGTFIPPKNVANDSIYVTVASTDATNEFSEGISLYIDEINQSKEFFVRVGKDSKEFVEKNGLEVKLDFGRCQAHYSFGEDNAVGGEDESKDKVVDDTMQEGYYNLNIDFNNLTPIVVDLSNYEVPCKKLIKGKIKLPSNIYDLEIDFYQESCDEYYYEEESQEKNCYYYYEDYIWVSKYSDENNTKEFIQSIDISPNSNKLVMKISYYDENWTKESKLILLPGEETNDHTLDGDELLADDIFENAGRYFEINSSIIDLGTIDLDSYFNSITQEDVEQAIIGKTLHYRVLDCNNTYSIDATFNEDSTVKWIENNEEYSLSYTINGKTIDIDGFLIEIVKIVENNYVVGYYQTGVAKLYYNLSDAENNPDVTCSSNTSQQSLDSDGDGYNDDIDAFPNDSSEWLDTDKDGIGNNADSDDDNDGISDELEEQYGLNPLDPNDANKDYDGDGISNIDEINTYHTNPNKKDSDEDGIDDNIEINQKSDPNDPESQPVEVKIYDKTSFYIAYDESDGRNYALVMPMVNKIYVHKAGDIYNLKRVDKYFEKFASYNNGELCFSNFKTDDTLSDSDKENKAKIDDEFNINAMDNKCYEVNYFYTQKDKVDNGVSFLLFFRPKSRLYEGLAGDGASFKVVKDGAKTYNENSITNEDYSFIKFDLEKALIEIRSSCENVNAITGQCEDESPEE